MNTSSSVAKSRLLMATAIIAVTALAGCSSSGTAGTNGPSSSTESSVGVDDHSRAMLPKSISDKGTLTVASGLNYPPFEFKSVDGANDGMDVELITAIGQRLGLKVAIQQAPFDAMLAGLGSNRFDVAMAPFTITPERRKQANFIHFIDAATLVSVLKGSSTGITGTDTLCGKSTGVITGSIAQAQIPALNDACAKANQPAIRVSVLQDQSALVQAVISRQIESMLDDSSTVSYVNKQTGDKLQTVGEPYEPAACGFAIAKNNADLLKAAQSALQSLMDDGTYEKIFTKWDQTTNAVKKPTIYTETEPSTAPSGASNAG
ncbi:ABC transporter substrate-binding protein [Paenarthrobacter sp. NPDC090522]|uniref:ABC transporter substrate-binding protein n=1 Tax=Paenarthrobacter sp. NPDC090522 TaxID=3364383 RepID=UPI00380B27F4